MKKLLGIVVLGFLIGCGDDSSTSNKILKIINLNEKTFRDRGSGSMASKNRILLKTL